MSVIFLSHSSSDAAVAAEVAEWLVAQGHRSLFLDFDPEAGIPAGRSWEQELYQQLRSCRAVIVLCSRASMASRWCFAEITQARSLGKVLLPVRIDDCTVDVLLASQQVVDLGQGRADGFERLRRGLLAAGLDPTDVFGWDGKRPPYPGLLALQQADAGVFFGRSAEVGAGLDLLNRVHRLGSPGVVVVVGASGSGKSSLVRAGLVPRLRRDVERWLVVDPWRPGDDPLAECAAVWSDAFSAVGESPGRAGVALQLREALDDPAAENPLVAMAGDLRRAAKHDKAKVLVVVDQFEELFDPTSGDAPGMLRLLRQAGEASGCPLVVVATLRSDFLGAFQKHSALGHLDCELLSVGPMAVEDVAEVIEGPARVAGIELESGLVQAMIAESASDDALPLLAFTLRELYDRAGGDGRLEVTEYRELGGLQGALARVADELVESQRLTPEQQDELRHALLAMVRLTDDERWVRQVVRWDELPDSVRPLLQRFVEARLLVSGGDVDTRTVEVAHEAMFRSWNRLAGWLQRSGEALQLRRDLDNAAEAWETGGHEPTDLWRGARLARAVELAGTGDLPFDATGRAFVDASQAEIDKQERSRRRRLQVAAGLTVGALILAGIAVALFFRARNESAGRTRESELRNAFDLAAQASEIAPENPALGLVLAAEATRSTTTPLRQATAALIDARNYFAERGGQQIRESIPTNHGSVSSVAFNSAGDLLATAGGDGTVRLWNPATGAPVGQPIPTDHGSVSSVAFNPAGDLLASGGTDGTVRLWDPVTGTGVGQPINTNQTLVYSVAFNPAGDLLASAGEDGTVRLWNPDTGSAVGQPIRASEGYLMSVAFNHDGDLLASAGGDGTVRLWNPDTGAAVGQPIPTDQDLVSSVAFNPRGDLLASAGRDGTVRLWDPATGTAVGQLLHAERAAVYSVAFNPAGDLLASAGDDGTVRLWDPATFTAVGQPLRADQDAVYSVAFNRAGDLLASGGDDGTARLWDPAAGHAVGQPLPTDQGPVLSVALNPAGDLLASAGDDGTVRLWNPATGAAVGPVLEGHHGEVQSVAFNADGDLLASAGDDGTVRLWDPTTGSAVGQPIQTNQTVVESVAFNADGDLLASAGDDGTVRLWDPTTGSAVGQPIQTNQTVVESVAFNADGDLLASAGDDGTVRLWDPTTGSAVGQPIQTNQTVVFGRDLVNSVTFNPDGDLLAAANLDGTVRLWDPATGNAVSQPIQASQDPVYSVAFNPAGDLLASAGDDGTLRLWDPTTGIAVGPPLEGHAGEVYSVAFDASGDLLASAGEDGTAQVWDAWDPDAACELAAPYVTRAQLERYLPSGHEPTCDLADQPTSGD